MAPAILPARFFAPLSASIGVYEYVTTDRKTSPLAIGCLVVIALIVFGSIVSSVPSHSTQGSSPAAPQNADPASRDLRQHATDKLLVNTDWSDVVVVARLCEQADLSKLTETGRAECAKAHLARSRQELEKGRAGEARRLLNIATSEGITPAQKKSVEPALLKAETIERRKRQRSEAAAGAVARRLYASTLREHYLDENLDIKVTVSGKENDRITLSFALFNAVWAHKLQKGDLLDEMQKLGFKRVDLTDNYDYHVYWNLH